MIYPLIVLCTESSHGCDFLISLLTVSDTMEENTNIKTFNYLFTNYKGRLTHFAGTYVGDEMVAEDLVVESFMCYWENRKTLVDHSNVLAFIVTVVKNKCLDYLRKMRTREEYIEYMQKNEIRKLNLRIATLEAYNPEKIFTDELQDLADKAQASLPQQTRDIFIRSRYDNQSHKEIAEELGVSTKTVEFHITKALKVLRVALKDYLPLFLYLQFADIFYYLAAFLI